MLMKNINFKRRDGSMKDVNRIPVRKRSVLKTKKPTEERTKKARGGNDAEQYAVMELGTENQSGRSWEFCAVYSSDVGSV